MAASRRAFLASAAALAAGAALSACGTARPGSGGPTTLVLAGTGQPSLFAQMIPTFEAQHPGVHVRWGLTTLSAATTVRDQMLASVGPDVLWVSDPDPYLQAGLLLPLNPLVQRSAYSLADFPAQLRGALTRRGQLYGLPRSAATGAYLLNVGLVNAVRGVVPGPTYTADDMASLWNTLTRGGVVGGELDWSPQASFYFNGWGGHLVDPADDRRCLLASAAAEACGTWMYARLRSDGSAQGLQGQHSTARFRTGGLAMKVVSASNVLAAVGAAGNIAWTILPFPVWPGGPATFVDMDAYAIAATTHAPEAAWELLQFISSPAWQQAVMENAPVPPARLQLWPAYLHILETAAPPLQGRGLQAFSDPLTQGWAFPPERFHDNTAAMTVLDRYWQQIYAPQGQLSVAKGFSAAAAAVDASQ